MIMSILQRIIKCPVCNRVIGIESPQCNVCKDLSLQKIDKKSNRSVTFIDFHPVRQQQNSNLKPQKQKDFIEQLFDNSFMPWFYETVLPTFWAMGLRGWGGIEKEAIEVSKFFGHEPKTVMDLSCGTGIMTRKLANSKLYQLVIALDYSESMLKMLIERIDTEKITSSLENLIVIRGNAESIPLISGSLDAIYAGAAMHCWSNPRKGVEEVYRVLRPGGKIFATTFAKLLPSQEFYFFTVEELWSLFQEVGFKKELLEIKSEGIYFTIKGKK